jgi:hypothetical protein
LKNLSEFFDSTTLKSLVEKANKLLALNAIWLQAIDNWSNYSKVANFEDGELVIEISSASKAARFRFEVPEIKKKLLLYREFSKLETIRYQIVYPPMIKEASTLPATQLSFATAKILEQTAKNIKHPALKESLMRLAGRYNL